MNKKLCCLLVSHQPHDRLLVEGALRPVFSDCQITQVVDAPGWQEALATGGFNLGIIAEAPLWAKTTALVQELKKRRPECPVIMLATPEQEEAALEALLDGLDDYILKSPEEMRRLPGVIRAARYRARRLAGEPSMAGAADFRFLFDAVPEVVFVHDPETGHILDANREACERLGYTREEFRNLNIDAISLGEHPFTQEEALRHIRETVREGLHSAEWLGRTKTGKPIWLEINAKLVVIGGQERVLSFGRNISRYKKAQEALREAETRYETLLDSAGDAIFIHDTAGRLLQVNDAACQLLGYTRAELQRMTLRDLDAPAHPSLQKKIRESRQRGHIFVETVLQRRDGAVVPVELGSRFIEYAGLPVAFNIARDITERRETEEKLRQSELKYRCIFETTGTATCIANDDAILSLVNDEFAKLSGYSREELEGQKSWTEFVVEEDLKRVKEYHHLLRTDPESAPQSYTFRFRGRQGQVKDILATINLIPGTSKTVASLLDITARQQVEKALRESEVRYRLLVETMNDGLGMQDENGRITFVNRRFCKMLGYAKEQLFGRPLCDFLDAANLEILKEQMGRRRKGKRQPYEITWTRKDGTPVSTSMSPVPMFDAAGKFQGSFAVIADHTAQQQAERALRASEEKYRAIFENTGTATLIVDKDTTISLVNAEFAKLSGYSREELEGKRSWTEFFVAEDLARMQEYHRQRRLNPQQAPRNYEARFIGRHGELKDMLVTVGIIPGTPKSVGSLWDITARKQAEQDLLQERRKFQILTENSPFAMAMIGKDGTFKYVNPKFSELFGYTLADVPNGKTWFRKAYPDPAYRHQVVAAWLKDLESYLPRENMPRTFIVTCKDGIEKIISFISLQLDDGDNLMTCEDITEQHRAEQALRQAEAEKSLILKNMLEMVTYRDRNNRILWANRATAAFFGLTPEQMVGRFCYEIFRQRRTPCPDCQIIKAMEAGQSVEEEFIFKNRIMLRRSSPVKDEKGEVQGCVTVVSDLTASKKAEAKMQLVIENAPVGIRITQQDRHIYANPALVRMFGYDRAEEIVGQPGDIIFDPDELELLREKREASRTGQLGPASFEAKGLKKNGTRLDVQVWQTEIEYQGEPALLDFILDFSEAKALRSRLLQAQKMEAIGTLAGGIAHDFNNILLPILINTEMLLEGLAPDSPLRPRLERVIKASRRAIDLVKQILAFSRQEERELSPVRLTPIIKDSLRLLRATLPATLEMRQNLEIVADTVMADPTQIQQVLINLCTNAAHALGDRGGVIDISLTEVEAGRAKVSRPQDLGSGPYLQLTVRDNGQGMDPATMEKIFDPYFTTKKPGEGTGLGLALVHGIVKKHGGVISVESEPGKGSTFHILLPRVEWKAILETGDSLPLPQGRERILLVDDDPEIVATLQQMMEQLGYRVMALTNGIEALKTFAAQPQDFDLVITDQTMPQLTGKDLAREILNLRPDIPIILCTGFSEVISPEKARDMGVREFIIKPIGTRTLAETMRRALMRKPEVS